MAGRRGILMALKKSGPLRAEDVATQLGITPSAVRQHLTGLHSDGLVEFEDPDTIKRRYPHGFDRRFVGRGRYLGEDLLFELRNVGHGHAVAGSAAFAFSTTA